MKIADKYEPNALYCLNDYNMLTRWSRYDKVPDNYAEVVNALIAKGCRIDIIGCEGHFGNAFNDNQFTATTLKDNIDYIADKIPTGEIWITELDFEANDKNQAAEWIETFMDVCFKHPRVGGIVLWTPWEGNRWRETLNSFVVDSNLTETPMGAKWLQKINVWTTNDTQTTGTDGRIAVTGIHGEYKITLKKDGLKFDTTVNLVPGTGPLEFFLPMQTTGVRMNLLSKGNYNRRVFINKCAIRFNVPETEKRQLFVKSYSVSGKLLAKMPVSFHNGDYTINNISKGYYIFKIGTVDRNYHTTAGVNVN